MNHPQSVLTNVLRPSVELTAQSGLIKWIRDRIGLQQEEYVWASGLHERLVSEGIFVHRAVAFEMQREPLMARH